MTLFRCESIGQALNYLGGLFQFSTLQAFYKIFMMKEAWFVFGMLVIEWIGRKNQHGLELLGINWKRPVRWTMYYVFIMLILWFSSKGVQVFVYFQF